MASHIPVAVVLSQSRTSSRLSRSAWSGSDLNRRDALFIEVCRRLCSCLSDDGAAATGSRPRTHRHARSRCHAEH
jgi:hypothetical protein